MARTTKTALKEVAEILQNLALSLDSLEVCLIDRKVLKPGEIDTFRDSVRPGVEESLQRLRSVIASLPNE